MSTAPVLVERRLPMRGRRLTHQRRSSRNDAASKPERAARRHSLDTYNQLATSESLTAAEWLKSTETQVDRRRQKFYLQAVLLDSLHRIWSDEGADYHNQLRQKDWERVHNCQGEWIGYRADCCHSYTKPIAVPIGCNHRLCPLCNGHRSEKGRERIRRLFPQLKHPYLLTLTIPNQQRIRKSDFATFRAKVRAFLKQHAGFIQGGVYSLETTYNWREKTWHIHVHILCECAHALPDRKVMVEFNGRRMRYFTLMKKRLEFAWLRLWTKDYGRRPRTRKGGNRGPDAAFAEWMLEVDRHKVREWRCGEWRDISLPAAERDRRVAWNRKHRRVVDIRPAKDSNGAAHEVLKYITKVSAFSDDPAAVEEFLKAVKGARMIQTFGSWYGVSLSDDANEMDWSHLNCTCGANQWVRIGTFYRNEVEMEPDGRWVVKRHVEGFGREGPYKHEHYKIN